MSRTGDTIQRCPHDEENPYTQILNALIRDKSISPNCRMIIIFLLSNKNNWTIRVPQLCAEFKNHLGRDVIYKLINEAIEAGYIKREEYIESGLRRHKYFLSEKPKFKKCLPLPEIQDTEAQDTGGQDTENQDSKERTSFKEEISKKKEHLKESNTPIVHKSVHNPAPPDSIGSTPFQRKDFSIDDPEVIELINMDDEARIHFRPEIFSRWITKYGPQFVLQTFKFFLHIKKTQKKPIPNPEAWMESAFKKNYAEANKTSLQNKEFAENLKKKYRLSKLKINKRYCQDTQTGKDYYYHLPPSVFEEQINQLIE